MTLVRYGNRGLANPRSPFGDLERQINRIFGEGFPFSTSGNSTSGNSWLPAIDIRDKGAELVLEADVPGLTTDDVEITIADNVLTLKGERKREKEDKENGYYRFERSYGRFERSFELPEGIEAEKVKADFKDGVLRVTMPKAEETKPRRIEVIQN